MSLRHRRSSHEVGKGVRVRVWGDQEGAWREGVGEGVVVAVRPPRPRVVSVVVIWWGRRRHRRIVVVIGPRAADNGCAVW